MGSQQIEGGGQVGGLARPFAQCLTPSESFSFDASHELSRVGVQRFCQVRGSLRLVWAGTEGKNCSNCPLAVFLTPREGPTPSSRSVQKERRFRRLSGSDQ